MQRYIGTKIILAVAMTRAAYNEFRGWPLPADENGDDEGYLVEYQDGGKPNVATHAGYVSWSPKEQFENAYRERPLIPGLAPHQQRVADERLELSEKLASLEAFLAAPLFVGLPDEERERLMAQHAAMYSYITILTERLNAFQVPVDHHPV